jgi:alcohol dehydrogenase class IV
MQFEFATASRIIFGAGAVRQAAPLAATMGRIALVVTGRTTRRAHVVLDGLAAEGVETVTFAVAGEPTVDGARDGTQVAQRTGVDLVVAFGGGSVIDAGKAIAALATNPGDPEEYLEVVGRGRPLSEAPLPFIAIPTTAGSGSEATRNAVLTSTAHRVKVSLRSPLMLPRIALVDPELTYDVPPDVTASTGLDALTQLIEPFVSSRANPITDALAREGIPRVARSLRRAFARGHDAAAREDLSLAALLGGVALANGGLGAAHGFAAPIGGAFAAPHGAICAALLPAVIDVNVRALRLRAPGSPALGRYEEVARLVTGERDAGVAVGMGWLRDLCAALRIPPLGAYGVSERDVPALVERAATASSMQANPVVLTTDELTEIVLRSL